MQAFRNRHLMTNMLAVLAIETGAMLIAIQMRLRITAAGKQLGADYAAQPPALFAILISAAVVTGFLFSRQHGRAWRFAATMVAFGLSSTAAALTLPDVSLLQLVYYVSFGAMIAAITILWPPDQISKAKTVTLGDHLRRLWENRMLIGLWILYNVRSRYSQKVLGVAWIILLPLSTSLIMSFVFSQILPLRNTGDVPFVSYFLSAMIAWHLFNGSIQQGAISVVSAMRLVVQVYFPREILVLVKLGEALVDFGFTFAAMLVINASLGIWPNANFIYLPLILIIQICFMLGLMLFLGYLGVIVRDIPQLIAVALQLLFYLTPIIYPVTAIPERLNVMLLLNPLALLLDAYRSIIVYNMPPDPVNLYYPAVAAGVLLYTGYHFFKANERRFADYL